MIAEWLLDTAPPGGLRANLWTGEETPLFDVPPRTGAGVAACLNLPARTLAPLWLPRPWDWRSRDVGWGLILPDDPDRDACSKAAGDDAPEPIRRLLAARGGAPVFRYQPGRPPGELTRYYSDGTSRAFSTAAPDRGMRDRQMPQYLLIYGSPQAVPWPVQFGLNASHFVGRLDLTVEEGLNHYVDALIDDWAGRTRGRVTHPLVWSADWGQPDVTALMARVVGGKLSDAFAGDDELVGRSWITGPAATCAALGAALADNAPAFICTTSHGMTGPLGDPAAMHGQLGSPVDSLRQVFATGDLGGWQPGGAIWYSHACCSAGSDAVSRYAELITPDQRGGLLLRQVAATAGARVAPLPRLLLGMPNPLAAFVGHVEPTFDWTLRDPLTKQELTHTIIQCLYDRLFTDEHPAPIGWALADIFAEAGNFLSLAKAPGSTDDRKVHDVYRQLAAIDRQNIVILGDPTVTVRRAENM